MAIERKRPAKGPAVIGWREWVSLPELGVPSIRAKIDTGARSASLHAFGLEVIEREGAEVARFAVHLESHGSPGPAVVVEAPVVGWRSVRNPGGRSERRPVIETRIAIGRHRIRTTINLTRRDEMGFPMLLGRQSVRRRFLVDPGRSYLIGTPPRDGDG
ncbi:MAG TPA: RimK/LysX family protein [Acidimicrobiia bacterium]